MRCSPNASAAKTLQKNVYETALNENLPEDVKAIVRRQYQGVKANHDRIRELRDQAAHL
jgi:uncharacterized protein (TIGR02284 family)